MQTLLKKYLVKSEKVISIDTIFVDVCDISIFYTAKGNNPEQYIILPTNLNEIDKDGKIQFDEPVLKEGFKNNGQYISSMSATYLSTFTVQKEGRKKIDELMRSMAKDCTQ